MPFSPDLVKFSHFLLNYTKIDEIPPFSLNFTKFRVNGAPARNLDLVPRNIGRFGDHLCGNMLKLLRRGWHLAKAIPNAHLKITSPGSET